MTPGKVPNYDFGDTAGMYPVVRPRVLQVLSGAPAEAAGFKYEDTIRSVDGKPITDPSDFVQYIEKHPSQSVKVEVDRAGRRMTLDVTPQPKAEGKGKIGISVGVYQRFGPGRAIIESAKYNWHIAQQTFAVLGKIFKREIAAKSALSGPIEIASMSGAAARSGFKNLLYFMGFISISIGILNLLPVPILDGGQITILLIGGVLRRDLSMVTKSGWPNGLRAAHGIDGDGAVLRHRQTFSEVGMPSGELARARPRLKEVKLDAGALSPAGLEHRPRVGPGCRRR